MKRMAFSLIGALLLMAGTPACAGWAVLPGLMAGGGQGLAIKATSLKELRFLTTVRQQYDYSCGSAALATLLTYQYRDPVSEEAAFKAMWDRGDKEKIRQEGFSLLDIKEYLEASGYAANGYVAPLDKLVEVGIPAIVLINEKGYSHFVVVKGVQDDSVLLGDPSVGSRIMPRAEFGKMWLNGILFVITAKKDRAVFNARSEWQIRPKSPLQLALHHDSMIRMGILRPGLINF